MIMKQVIIMTDKYKTCMMWNPKLVNWFWSIPSNEKQIENDSFRIDIAFVSHKFSTHNIRNEEVHQDHHSVSHRTFACFLATLSERSKRIGLWDLNMNLFIVHLMYSAARSCAFVCFLS